MMKREILLKHPCFKVVSVSKTPINNDFRLLLSGNYVFKCYRISQIKCRFLRLAFFIFSVALILKSVVPALNKVILSTLYRRRFCFQRQLKATTSRLRNFREIIIKVRKKNHLESTVIFRELLKLQKWSKNFRYRIIPFGGLL